MAIPLGQDRAQQDRARCLEMAAVILCVSVLLDKVKKDGI